MLVFERHVARTLAEDLDVHLKQLLAGIDVDAQGNLVLTQPPTDPRFADPLSGLYWQVSDDRGQVLRSRSLWDSSMKLPTDQLGPGEIHQHEAEGPGGQRVLVAERAVVLSAGGKRMSRARGRRGRPREGVGAASAFAKDLAIALVLLACVLAIATWIQVGVGLRPLVALRRGVADIRAGRVRHLPSSVPAEVEPLVEEVNALIDAQEREIERSRSRAADLAHGLKTPLAALAADASRLHERGEHAIALDIEAVGEVDGPSRRSRVGACQSSWARKKWRQCLDRARAFDEFPDRDAVPHTRAVRGSRSNRTFADNLRVPFDRTDLRKCSGICSRTPPAMQQVGSASRRIKA